MGNSVYDRFEYFIVANGSVMASATFPPQLIEQGTLLSREGFIRHGCDETFIERTLESGTLRAATADEIAERKAAVGITPDRDDERATAMRVFESLYDKTWEVVKDDPVKVAELLLDTLRHWRYVEDNYFKVLRTPLGRAPGRPVWYDMVGQGFLLDMLHAGMEDAADRIERAAVPVKRTIAKLRNIEATALQKFERSMRHHRKTPNEDWAEADMLVEMLPHKIEDQLSSVPPVPAPVWVKGQDNAVETKIVGQSQAIETKQAPKPLWDKVKEATFSKVGAGIGAAILAVIAALWTTYGKPSAAKVLNRLSPSTTQAASSQAASKPTSVPLPQQP